MKFFILVSLFSSLVFSQEFGLDTETSMAIPKFRGEVTLIKGQATAFEKDPNIGEPLKRGSKIYRNQTVKTAGKSIVKLRMIDEIVVTLGPKSELTIEKFDYKSRRDRKSVYNLVKGKIRAHFPNKAKPGDLTVRTKTFSMGVRGTKVLVNANDEATQFALLTGKVSISNVGTKEETILIPGDHFISYKDNNNIVNKVEKLSTDTMNNLLARGYKESKNFNPFLEDYLAGKNKPTVMRKRNTKKINRGNESGEANAPKWKNRLKELNKRLEENQLDD